MLRLQFAIQPILQGGVEENTSARITDVALAAKTAHVVADDLARCADVLGEHFVRQGFGSGVAILVTGSARTEPDEGASETMHGVFGGEALHALLECRATGGNHLNQGGGQARLSGEGLRKYLSAPLDGFDGAESDGLLLLARYVEKGGFAEEVAGIIDVHENSNASSGKASEFDAALGDAVDIS